MKKYLKVVHDNRANLSFRIANYFIDYIVVSLSFFILGALAVILNDYLGVTFVYDWVSTFENLSKLEDILLTTLVTLLYYFLMEHFAHGRTIGKFVTGTKVISRRYTAQRIPNPLQDPFPCSSFRRILICLCRKRLARQLVGH